MDEKAGAFIVFEGIDGSGKTTHHRILSQSLQNMGFDLVVTAEPTKERIGMLIRDSIQSPSKRLPVVSEALLFAADRFYHTKNLIEPALSAGKIVISDRYVHSSYVYQGIGGVDIEWLRNINRFALTPDLCIYIDITPDLGQRRLKRRTRTVFEESSLQRRIRDLYLRFVDAGEMVLINGDAPVSEVQRQVKRLALEKLKELGMPRRISGIGS